MFCLGPLLKTFKPTIVRITSDPERSVLHEQRRVRLAFSLGARTVQRLAFTLSYSYRAHLIHHGHPKKIRLLEDPKIHTRKDVS